MVEKHKLAKRFRQNKTIWNSNLKYFLQLFFSKFCSQMKFISGLNIVFLVKKWFNKWRDRHNFRRLNIEFKNINILLNRF